MYSKPILGDDTNCELVGWTSKDLGPNGAFHLPTHHQPRLRDKENKWMCVQTSIEKVFIKVKEEDA